MIFNYLLSFFYNTNNKENIIKENIIKENIIKENIIKEKIKDQLYVRYSQDDHYFINEKNVKIDKYKKKIKIEKKKLYR